MRLNLVQAGESAIGGFLATSIMQQGLKHAAKLPPPLQPPGTKEDPGEFLVHRLESGLGRDLPATVHRLAATGMHYGYGAMWPAGSELRCSGVLSFDIHRSLHQYANPSATR